VCMDKELRVCVYMGGMDVRVDRGGRCRGMLANGSGLRIKWQRVG